MNNKQATEVSQDFVGFSVTVRTGDRSKKRLANGVTISVGDEAVQATARLSLRQARALRRMLEKYDV